MSLPKLYNESRVLLGKFILHHKELLEGINNLDGWKLGTYGESTQGHNLYYLIHYVGEDKPTVMIVSGQHGSEPAGIAAATLLPYSLSFNDPVTLYYRISEILENINIVIVPCANPDGFYEYIKCYEENNEPSWKNTCIHARFNSRMRDINRDWVFLEEKETRNLHLLVNKIKPDIVLDHHEFLAARESPPKWAIDTEGFMATLTDNPYLLVRDDIVELSAKLMRETGYAIERITGWKTKYRHFGGGERSTPPPYILGAHLPLENKAKLLVETWGVGLHDYLWGDRVNVHLTAMYSVLQYIADNREEILNLRNKSDEPNTDYSGYIISGDDRDKALELLRLHGIDVDGNKVYLKENTWRITTVLLDEDIEYNRRLAEKRLGPYTLQRKYRIKVERF